MTQQEIWKEPRMVMPEPLRPFICAECQQEFQVMRQRPPGSVCDGCRKRKHNKEQQAKKKLSRTR